MFGAFSALAARRAGEWKIILYQSDLETEIAYQLVLGSSKRSLDRIGLKKNPSVRDHEKWKFLEEAAQTYLKALK